MPRPGRVDQVARRRARDEDPRQVEQQRRVLVAARVEPGQRHQQFAAAQIGVADQVEGGIGRDEAVACRTSRADARRSRGSRRSISRELRRGAVRRRPAAASDGAASMRVEQIAATGWPIAAQSGLGVVARPRPAPRAARRAAPRRAVRAARRAAAAAAAPDCRARSCRIWPDADRRRLVFEQHGIADIVQRRAVFPGRQRAAGGAGKIMKAHEIPWSRGLGQGPARHAPIRAPPPASL